MFGMIMMLFIVMEFKYFIVRVVLWCDSIIQVKMVILIGLIVLVCKFVIFDLEIGFVKVVVFVGVILVFGVIYWLLCECDDWIVGESLDD